MTPLSKAPLYLSRLLLNPRSRQVMSEFGHPYEMHRTLMRGFPEATDVTNKKARDEFGVLFRAEVDEPSGAVKVLVQSRVEPDWSFLNELNDYLAANAGMAGYEFKDIMAACRNIQTGQVLRFRLRANPTKRIGKHGHPMKGKRIELYREHDQIDWLIGKGQVKENGVAGGFILLTREVKDMTNTVRAVSSVKVCNEGKLTGRKRDASRGHSTTHFAVIFEGLLRVTDTNAFLESIVRGIGPGKAFGFGLLSVAPV